jgi:predicted nucleotidyltransferase
MRKQSTALIVRLPKTVHEQLKREARAKGVSLNRHCLRLLSGSRLEESPPTLIGACGPDFLRELINEVVEDFADKIQALVLYGSWARGQAGSSSDIDLLIVVSDEVVVDRDLYSEWRTKRIGNHEVSPLFVNLPSENEEVRGIWLEIALDGVVLFDRESRACRYLAKVRRLIASGRVKRKMTHGHPYWVYIENNLTDAEGKG